MSSYLLNLARDFLVAIGHVAMDAGSDSTNLTKSRKEFKASHQVVDGRPSGTASWISAQQSSTRSAMSWSAATRMRPVGTAHQTSKMSIPQAGGGSECVSADLVDVETYPVTDYVIGEAASSGADHVSDALGFECRIQEN